MGYATELDTRKSILSALRAKYGDEVVFPRSRRLRACYAALRGNLQVVRDVGQNAKLIFDSMFFLEKTRPPRASMPHRRHRPKGETRSRAACPSVALIRPDAPSPSSGPRSMAERPARTGGAQQDRPRGRTLTAKSTATGGKQEAYRTLLGRWGVHLPSVGSFVTGVCRWFCRRRISSWTRVPGRRYM